MTDNPFTRDHYAPPISERTLGVDPSGLAEIAAWIATAMASGLLGNAFSQYVNQLRNRSGKPGVDALKARVLEAMKKVKRKPGVSHEDLALRVEQIFKDVEQ